MNPAGHEETERRQLTVMFADLVGSTARAASMDAEDYQAVVAAYHACVADIVDRHGGLVSQFLGDGVLAYFGYPKAREDDAARSLHAALAIIAEVASVPARGPPLQTRVGLATGTVVVGPVFGRSIEREHGAVGETPNLAARLQSMAEPQSIVVDQRTRRLAGPEFQFVDLGTHTLKGFPRPVRAYNVRRRDDAAGTNATEDSALFVGREFELAQLDAALAAACRGRGCVIAIKGDAGIGKSHLVREFLNRAGRQGCLCRQTHILDFGTPGTRHALGVLALGVLGCLLDEEHATGDAELIRKALEARVIEPEGAPFLYDLTGVCVPDDVRVRLDAMDKKRRDAERGLALASLVVNACRRRPVVVAVEDVHWADQAGLMQLRQLCAQIQDHPAIVVLTTRSEGDPFDASWRAQMASTPVISLELAPLTRREAEELAGRLSGFMQDRVRDCVDRAAGNPLFLEQLLRNEADGDRAAVPDTIQGLVQARIDRLAPDDRRALQAAAILGQQFTVEALSFILDGSPFNIESLVERLMVKREVDGFRFSHALVHQAVYDSLLRARRRELHQRAAQWFTSKDPQLVAAHLERAEHHDEAARAYLEAAREQAAAHRYESAAQLVERGLHLTSHPGDRSRLLLLLGDVQHDLGHLRDSLGAFKAAATHAADPAVLCRALIGRAGADRVLDDLDDAALALGEAETVAIAHDLQLELANIAFLRGNLCFPRGDVDGCLREHSQSLQIARTIGAPGAIAAALGGLGDAEYVRGRMLSAQRHFSECVEFARAHHLGKTEVANLPMAAFTLLFAGEPAKALSAAQEAIKLGENTGQLRAQVIAHHAAYLCRQGRLGLEAASMHATKAIALSQQLQAPRFEAESLAFRADLHRLAGCLSEARTVIDEALEIARRSGMAFFGPSLLAIAALISTDPTEQRALLAEAEALVGTSVSHNHYFLRRYAIAVRYALGEADGIEENVRALEHYTRQERTPWSDFHIDRGRLLAQALRDPSTLRSEAWRDLASRASTLWLDDVMAGLESVPP